MFDEIYIHQNADYIGRKLAMWTDNNELASTVLAFMVYSLCSTYPEVNFFFFFFSINTIYF